jgi:hypothetical protein
LTRYFCLYLVKCFVQSTVQLVAIGRELESFMYDSSYKYHIPFHLSPISFFLLHLPFPSHLTHPPSHSPPLSGFHPHSCFSNVLFITPIFVTISSTCSRLFPTDKTRHDLISLPLVAALTAYSGLVTHFLAVSSSFLLSIFPCPSALMP